MATTTEAPPEQEKNTSDPEEAGVGEALEEVESDAPPERTIHDRMVAILAEMPAIGKARENTQQHFHFRGHDDVLNALNPLLAKHGVYIVPEVIDRIAEKRETGSGKVMYEVSLLVRYYFIGATGDQVVGAAWGEGTDMGDKATSKAMTMAFKSVLAQSFAISTEEAQDPDAETPEDTVALGTAAKQAEQERQEKEAREREETRGTRLRARIGALCTELDEQTGAEAGTFAGLVADATQLSFGSPYDTAEPPTLETIGRSLKELKDSGVTEAPDQLDLA